MKQKLLTIKSLLVAALLGVGTNAWGNVTPVSQDYSDSEVALDWTSGDTGRYTVSRNDAGYLTVNAVGTGGNGTTITGTTVKNKAASGASFDASDDFTMIFDLQLKGGNNQTSSFYVYDSSNSEAKAMLGLAQTAVDGTTWKINGSTEQTVTLAKNTWYTFKLSKSGALLYLTVTPTAGGDAVFARQTITILSEVGGLGNMIFNTKRYYSYMAIDNVVLRDLESGDVPAVTPVNYTIKYKNESDVTIKDDVVVNSYVGAEVTASSAQMAAVTYNAQKYIYKSGNKNITLVADEASNVITLVYREAETYTYKLTSDCLGTVFVNSSDFEGNDVYVPYPKYELKDGTLYQAAGGNSGDYFRDKYTLTTNIDETKAYSVTAIENVVFYVEGENISGASVNNNERGADTRNSNGATGYAAGTAGEDDLTITTLAPGKYKIVANLHTSTSAGGTSTFKLGANTFAAVGTASQQNTEKTSDEFAIYESTALILQAGGGKTNSVDYVYVIKTGEATISKTITAAGWATYCSPYALDLANATGLDDAYIVTGGEGGVLTKTSVKGGTVPANTGLLLKGTEGSAVEVTIPVVASSSTDVGANILEGVTTNTEIAANAGWVLMGSPSLGFYQNSGEFTVGANTAYIPVAKLAVPAGARPFFSLDGDATGISAALMNKETMNNEVYNLKGQRVSQPTKGLYIVNGKKVVIK